MNPGAFFPGVQSALTPIWYPPVAAKWIITGLIVFAGSIANRMPPNIRSIFIHPIGFFFTAVTALGIYQAGFPPAAFATLFFLLSVWSIHLSNSTEGYLNATNTVDWVTNSKRWYVEKALKEQPLAIQDKDVSTYPVQGASAQSGTSSGNT